MGKQVTVLRAFDIPGHGKGEKGQVLTVSQESAEYLLAYNTDRPLITIEDFDGTKLPKPEDAAGE